MGHEDHYSFQEARRKPTRIEAIRKIIYDPDKKTVLGRTGISWGKIFIFYVTYYLFLAALFSICFFVFSEKILSADHPTYYNDHNFYDQPGMSFLPQNTTDSTEFRQQFYQIMTFSPSDPASYAEHVDQLRQFFQGYTNIGDKTVKTCDLVDKATPCDLNLTQFEPDCWDSNDPTNFKFGYDVGSPCVLLRINKMYNWEPEEYTVNPNTASIGGRWELGRIPIACNSFQARKTDPTVNLGPVTHHPSGGFPVTCFPFCSRNTDYKSPFAMVKFHNLTTDVLTSIECSYYATNVIPERRTGTGMAAFQFVVKS